MIEKNDNICVTVDGMTAEGNGVAHLDGMAVFIAGTMPGETVNAHVIKVKSTYAIAKRTAILSPSPDRIPVDCPVSEICGGCSYRHMTYQAECRIKYRRVADALARIGGLSLVPDDLVPAVSDREYRNKAQYPVAPGEDGKPVCGFFANHSHRVIACESCALQPTVFSSLVSAVLKWMNDFSVPAYDERCGVGLVRHLYFRRAEATEEIMAVIVINGETLPYADELVTALRGVCPSLVSVQYNINRKITNVIMGDICRVIWGKPAITDEIAGISVQISPLSFYQVNRTMAEMLYRRAADFAEPEGKTVLDLYCGVGTIGLTMASRASRLIGVEIVPEAVEDAGNNAARNHIENAEFLCGDAATAADTLADRGIMPDVVLLDPPRKGCSPELIETVALRFCPERIVYVSCDPATLARDLKLFEERGYHTERAVPYDLFPRTTHVETVVLMSKTD